MTAPPDPHPDLDQALLDLIRDAGEHGMTAGQLYQASAGLWRNRSHMHAHLAGMARDRKVCQLWHRGPYLLPISAPAR